MQRLKTRPQFQAALAAGTVARTAHFALHRVNLDVANSDSRKVAANAAANVLLFTKQEVWMGAMVPKRWAKRAVTRNAIKRQIYSVSSDFESALTKAAHVVRLRSGFDRAHFVSASSAELKAAVRAELEQLFSRVGPSRLAQEATGRHA